MTYKNRRKLNTATRALIQVFFFIAAAELFSSAFAGVRRIAETIGHSEPLMMDSFLILLIALLAYTIIFGRFFCGYACAFGFLGDVVYALSAFIQKKIFHKQFRFPKLIDARLHYCKYILLALVLIFCFLGKYDILSPADPWTLFAALISGDFSWKSEYIISAVCLLIVLAGMCLSERFFCRCLCPMGAVFALMPVLPQAVILKDKGKCLGSCKACQTACPCSLTLEEDSGECIQCNKCITSCFAKGASCGVTKLRGNEVWLTVIKAGVLFACACFCQ